MLRFWPIMLAVVVVIVAAIIFIGGRLIDVERTFETQMVSSTGFDTKMLLPPSEVDKVFDNARVVLTHESRAGLDDQANSGRLDWASFAFTSLIALLAGALGVMPKDAGAGLPSGAPRWMVIAVAVLAALGSISMSAGSRLNDTSLKHFKNYDLVHTAVATTKSGLAVPGVTKDKQQQYIDDLQGVLDKIG